MLIGRLNGLVHNSKRYMKPISVHIQMQWCFFLDDSFHV